MKPARLMLSLLLFAGVATAQALEVQAYSPQRLADAEQANRPIALHFRADWCPTCRAQDAVLQSLAAEPALPLTVLSVSYDTEKDLKRRFHVHTQSTIVVLHGAQETARLVGETSRDAVRDALRSALSAGGAQ